MTNQYWKDEDTLVPGDILHNTKADQHYLLLEMVKTSLSQWLILNLETGNKFTISGVGRNIYECDMHLKRI
jgi:hypothetical protein